MTTKAPKAKAPSKGAAATKAKADAAANTGAPETAEKATVPPGAEPSTEPSPAAQRAAAAAAAQKLYDARRADGEDELDDEDEERVTLAMARVLITRDNTKTDKDVFAHEVDILRLIHGEENVEVYGTRDVEVVDFDPQTELDRLLRFYGKNGEEAVVAVYGRSPARLAQAVGVSMSKSDPHRNRTSEQAMAVDHSVVSGNDAGRIKVARIVPPKQKSGKR